MIKKVKEIYRKWKRGKAAQREELQAITESYKDIKVDNIRLLIRNSPERYIVFVDSDYEVDWETTDRFDAEHAEQIKGIDRVSSRIEDVEQNPAVAYLSEREKTALARLLGCALVSELDGQSEEAEETISSAKDYLKRRTSETSRRWQLVNAFVIALLVFLIWTYFAPKEYIGFGCLGALFSILCKTGNTEYDCQAGRALFALETFARFLAAVISAYMAEQLFQMDLLFTALKSDKTDASALALICFAAGFSERLVPSIICRLTTTQEKGEDNHVKT